MFLDKDDKLEGCYDHNICTICSHIQGVALGCELHGPTKNLEESDWNGMGNGMDWLGWVLFTLPKKI